MKKRWINCAALLKYHDVPPVESVRAVTGGKIEAYSIQLRKIVDAKHFEIKNGLRKDIETESDRMAQETGKAYLASISPDVQNIGVMLDEARAGKILEFRLNNNIPVFYVIHPYDTLPISFDWLESIIQNPSRKIQCEELSFLQFKYEDAVRCFGLAPEEAATVPVARGQEAAVVEAPAQLKIPAKQTASTRDEQREICRRMREEGKPDIEIAVALWPDDGMAWAAGQERLDKKTLDRERNRLEKKVGRLLPALTDGPFLTRQMD